ncbi:MAG: hypothetical protein ACLQUT_09700 [Thermoleophilia bacterium]|jgi:uncharacterized membrane protein
MNVRRRLAFALVTLLAMALFCLPVVVTIALRWYRTKAFAGMLGKGSGIYVILPLVYLVWTPLVLVALVVVLDHLGYHYVVTEKRPELAPRQRRRLLAGLGFFAQRPTFSQGSAFGGPNDDSGDDAASGDAGSECGADSAADASVGSNHDDGPSGSPGAQ